MRTSARVASRPAAVSRRCFSSPPGEDHWIRRRLAARRVPRLTSSMSSRCCVREEESCFTIASAGTARGVSRHTCNSYWPSGFSAHSWLHGARTAERAPMSMMSSCRLPAPASPSRAREGGESGREPRATLARVLAGRRIAPEVTSEGDSPAANSSVAGAHSRQRFSTCLRSLSISIRSPWISSERSRRWATPSQRPFANRATARLYDA